MFTLEITVGSTSLDAIKAELMRTLRKVKSSHRCEAVARGLGFRTYASLLAAGRSPDPAVATAHGADFSNYMAEHGFGVPPLHFYRAVARVAIRDVLDNVRMLTLDGIGFGRPKRKSDGTWEDPREHYVRVVESKNEFLSDDAVEQFLLSLALLSRMRRTETIRPGTSSYKLKHIAENYVCTYPEGEKLGPRYVTNGALLAAAIHAGFSYKTYVDELGYESPHVNFNMSKVVLDDVDCEVRPNGAKAQDRRRRAAMRKSRSLYFG